MKRINFFVALLFCYHLTFAQGANIKPAIGMNVMDFSKDPSTGTISGLVGWQIGGTVMFGQKKWYIEPGIFFVHRSSEYSDNTTPADDLQFDIQGIRMPVAVGLNILNGKSFLNVRACGGASVFLLTSIKDLDKDDFNKGAFGLFAGAGVDLSMFFIDAKYEWSLTNVQKNIDDIDVGKTRSLYIDAGIRIRL